MPAESAAAAEKSIHIGLITFAGSLAHIGIVEFVYLFTCQRHKDGCNENTSKNTCPTANS